MESEEWYYVLNGEQKGPISFASLQQEWKNKTITKESYVWCSLMDNWKPIQDYPELQNKLTPAKISAPPPIPKRASAMPTVATPHQETSKTKLPVDLLKEIESSKNRNVLRHVSTDHDASPCDRAVLRTGRSTLQPCVRLLSLRVLVNLPLRWQVVLHLLSLLCVLCRRRWFVPLHPQQLLRVLLWHVLSPLPRSDQP